MTDPIDRISADLSRLAPSEADRIARMIQALDDRYDLTQKMTNEPGIEDITKQLLGRLVHAYGGLAGLQGQKILDIACGSNTSRAPSRLFVNTPFSERTLRLPNRARYTAQFEPWFCRILLELGAYPVGVDIGDLDGEAFEHYQVDLGQEGALNFLPDRSFDGVQDSRLFGSPEFTAQFPAPADRLKVALEIRIQERRLLKAGGIVIHSDAVELTGGW